MKLVNAAPKGPTVYITDLKVRIGRDGILIRSEDAVSSTDLRIALDEGMIRLVLADAEKNDLGIADLVAFAKRADAKREGRLLFAQMESILKGGRPEESPDVAIRPALFELVG